MTKYLVTATINVLQIATVEADSEEDALFIAFRDHKQYGSGRNKLHWSHAESFDPPSYTIVSDEDDDDDLTEFYDDEEEQDE